MKALILLALLWGMAGCATLPPLPMAASDAPTTNETFRPRERWMESDSSEKQRRKGHVSGRDTRKSACEPAPVVGGQRGPLQKGQKSKRS